MDSDSVGYAVREDDGGILSQRDAHEAGVRSGS